MSSLPRKSLTDRLWNEEPFIELVKIVGYQGRLVSECYEQAKPLLEKFGQPTMEEAAALVARMESKGDTSMAYLTDETRRKAWPILGPDPENLPWWAKKEDTLFAERPKPRGKKKQSS